MAYEAGTPTTRPEPTPERSRFPDPEIESAPTAAGEPTSREAPGSPLDRPTRALQSLGRPGWTSHRSLGRSEDRESETPTWTTHPVA
jgi:hypothetical protein